MVRFFIPDTELKNDKKSLAPAQPGFHDPPPHAFPQYGGGERSTGVKECSHCHTTSTPLWRRDPGTHRTLCNACGLYLNTNHSLRPVDLIRMDGEDDADRYYRGPVCVDCRTRKTSMWRVSKAGEQLCNACWVYERMNERRPPLPLKSALKRPRSSSRHPTTVIDSPTYDTGPDGGGMADNAGVDWASVEAGARPLGETVIDGADNLFPLEEAEEERLTHGRMYDSRVDYASVSRSATEILTPLATPSSLASFLSLAYEEEATVPSEASSVRSPRSHSPPRLRHSPATNGQPPHPRAAPYFEPAMERPYFGPPMPEKIDYPNYSTGLPRPATSSSSSVKSSSTLQTVISTVAFVVLEYTPRQIYLHFLLRIPSLYFSRVTRIFEDARLSLPDIKRMARAKTDQWDASANFIWQPSMQTPDQMPLPRSLLQFRSSWEGFIDSLMREWKTLNVISVLLMSAILTMLQIEAASHPITRTSALFSLICALMSLLYGCMYIIRFGTMRKMHKASTFANEAQKTTPGIWWNVWVLLAMPAVWLAWSIISFLTCIMSFIWLSGSSQDQLDFAVSPRTALGLRIGLTAVFSLGVIYFGLIVRTFHRYGDPLDREWMRTVNEWTKEALNPYQNEYRRPTEPPVVPLVPPGVIDPTVPKNFQKLPPSNPLTSRPSAFFKTPGPICARPAEPFTILQLGSDVEARPFVDPMWAGVITVDDYDRFMLDISSAWNGQLELTRPEADATSSDLPAYTLVSPALPDNFIPTSAESSDAFVILPPTDRSITSSESSYGRPRPSKYMAAGFSAPDSSALKSPSTEGDQKIFTKSLFASNDSPADGVADGDEARTPPTQPDEEADRAPPDPVQTVFEFIDLWNERYFYPRNLEASLVHRGDASGPAWTIDLASRSSAPPYKRGNLLTLRHRV
ncbi:hypothetical protein MVEN_01561000 [Mycena venus]|uniref:GATA-type domain-containing protein n=1 Tax=Mycena venus TaxID=2733690 RepID=A0A8H7CPK8_9AGAR|nr:hypothetical protein MVEN_01561000 [Mycena venus]